MKAIDLDITQWQDLTNEFMATLPTDKLDKPIAFRCENSQLSFGWKCGGFTMNGHRYTAFAPFVGNDTERAMLAVREDFLRWVVKRLNEIDKLHKEELKSKQPKQEELGL